MKTGNLFTASVQKKEPVKRRKFLSAILGGVSAGLSGCIDLGDNKRNNNSTDENPNNGTDPVRQEPVFDSTVTEPSYEVRRPPFSEEQWNPDYLGTNMPREPSIDFEILENAVVDRPSISFDNRQSSNEFVVNKFGSRNELSEKVVISHINEFIGFGNNYVAVIETGFVSSEYTHEWVRMEEVSDGYWIHGYYRKPFRSTPNLSTVSSAVIVPKSDSGQNPTLYVSLTVSTGTVVNFSSDEGVVGVDSY